MTFIVHIISRWMHASLTKACMTKDNNYCCLVMGACSMGIVGYSLNNWRHVLTNIVGGLAWVLEVFPDVASGIAWVLGVCPSIASGISWKIRCKPENNKSRLGVNLRTIRARHL
jgi:hypothetical protein